MQPLLERRKRSVRAVEELSGTAADAREGSAPPARCGELCGIAADAGEALGSRGRATDAGEAWQPREGRKTHETHARDLRTAPPMRCPHTRRSPPRPRRPVGRTRTPPL